MARSGYLGKISAIVSINTSSVKPSLDSSAKDINAWAKSTQSRISGAANSAGRALEGIFTPLQRLQAAIKNANRNPLDLKIQNPGAYLQLAKATEQIAKPLGQVQSQFAGLASSVQAELLPVLQSAQKQTTSLFNAISSGAKVSDRDIENTTARVERLNQVIKRAGEASTLSRGLATGQELRFQSPDFVAQTRRASELQQQAASLSPRQLASQDFAGLVSQQRQAAIEAERLLAALDRIRTTRNGDAVAAQKQYNEQIAALGQINNRLSEQITLAKASVVENQGEATNVKDRLAASARLLKAQQDEASFRGKAADEAEREAQATARVVEQLNRAFVIERDRRSGATARRNASAFDDSTRGLVSPQPRQQRENFFAAPARTLDSELQRTIDLYQQFIQLPPQAQAALEANGVGLNNIANAAKNGSAGLQTLIDANDRMAESMRKSSAEVKAAASSFVSFDDLALQARKLKEASDAAREANFGPSIAGAFESSSISSAAAKLSLLRGLLVSAGISSGDAAEAVDGLRASLDAARNSAGGLAANAAAVDAAFNDAAEKVAAATGQRADDVRKRLGRVGDVGRLGVDKFSLALNQAAFAIDDFFSSTGGLEFKIRAISNNITQLAFIIGNTKGLFIGLAAVIGAQALVAITRWVSGGKTAADSTKALNEALARQKSLVEDLARAFESLGDSITKGAFSEPAKRARDFQRELEDVRKKQKELRDERVLSLDPRVAAARGREAQAQRELGESTTVGQAAAAQRRLEAARRDRREAEQAALSRPAPSGADVRGVVLDVLRAESQARAAQSARSEDNTVARAQAVQRELAAGERRQREALRDLNTNDPIELVRQLRSQIGQLESRGGNAEQIARLESLIASLELPLQRAIDELANSIIESSRSVSAAFEEAQQEVSEAIKSGIPDAILFRARLDAIGNELEKAFDDLADINKRRNEGTVSPEVAEREARAVQARIDAINRDKDAINARADALRRERTVDPQRQLDARIEAISANLNAAGLESGQFARRLREIQFQRDTLQSQINQTNPQDSLTLNILRAAQAALNAETLQIKAATSALTRFTEALDRATREAESNLQAAQQRADEARQRDLGRSTPGARDARQRAEIDLANQQAAKNQVDDAVARARARLEERAAKGDGGAKADIEAARKRVEAARDEADRVQGLLDKAPRDIAIGRQGARAKLGFNNTAAIAGLFDPLKTPIEIIQSALDAGKDDVARELQRLQDIVVSAEDALGLDFVDAAKTLEIELDKAIKGSAAAFDDLNKANRDLADAIKAAEADLSKEFARLTEIDEALRSGSLSAAEQSALISERRRISEEVGKAVELDPAVRRARDASTALEERAKSSARGRELTATPAQRAAEELDQQIADIRQFASDAAEESSGLPGDVAKIRDRMNEAINRVTEDSRRAVAPAVFALSDAVQNAVLQGPSRAALSAADVTTMEGSRELNRLLRGDDPARDVNLVELQKQSRSLEEHTKLLEDIAKGFAGVAP